MGIFVVGGATSTFGELWSVSPRTLAKEVVEKALFEANIKKEEIEALFVANMLSSSLAGQDNLGAFFAETLGLAVPAFRIEGACASGGLAVHTAVLSLRAKFYQTVLVLGIEKMTDYPPEEVARALMGGGSDEEREGGATFPALYALLAQAYQEKYKIKEEDLAWVAVKNHFHGSLNPQAQYRREITLEQVLKSPPVASPLKLLDCSPISDGAAALLLSSQKPKNNSWTVEIIASAVATDTLGLAEREDLTTLSAAKKAGEKAYQMARVSPKEIDVAEVHDCFTIAEIMAMEDLGFFPQGKAASAIVQGKTRLFSGHPVVNPSGGLKAAGHPVGATGVKQIVEVYHQLKGTAGKRQVPQAKIGLTHNVGGSGGVAVVHLLKRV